MVFVDEEILVNLIFFLKKVNDLEWCKFDGFFVREFVEGFSYFVINDINKWVLG